ncbi:tRNA pseudouridine(38-40) synthase TruA [Clostridium sp. 19966]|uniref:tRNA pseudouridine(38-40) synthase TruA n=1 Tax=Clostridium sp. 19966 TaxID=2768166 RepID=UPI0028E01C55|nr:tRNA pseudouridine(38-40) synthase TruA [Clostridium sp. 19966]MDT8715848.1 tRNA pseudouridine(38-40) synthase TruA [Clostridium sp. 19966]
MRNIKLVLEYDGNDYAGWQRQKNSLAVQQVLEKAIFNITREQVNTIGCSRTDSGVHAKEFVCNFYTESNIEDKKFRNAINAKLPEDIRILSSIEMETNFHSRYCCKGKTYSYTIFNREINSAIYRNYSCHVRKSLNIDKMVLASQYFIGKHDFSAFRTLGSSAKTTERTIKSLDVLEVDPYIKIYGTADGFLYNMMRIICGTLIDVGLERKKPEDIIKILESRDRKKAGKASPAQGLCLEKVYY